MTRILLAALLVGSVALAQPPVLRKGISVEMAVTKSATPMREADLAGAVIVAVTRNGQAYLEVAPVTPAALAEQLRASRAARVYVKADTRAPYASVAAVLGALRTAGASSANLLSSQSDSPGSPTGVNVSLGGSPDAREKAIVLDPGGPLVFGDFVDIIDASRAAGVKVFVK